MAITSATLKTLVDSLKTLGDSLKDLADSHRNLAGSMGELVGVINRYVDSADARMKRIEENLDGLIRAITIEHGNGKGKH